MIDFNLEEYLSDGIENIVKGAVKASLSNPQESLFIAKYAICAKKAAKLRKKAEKMGKHIPPFLIASITSSCNLNCKGCYARANHICGDDLHNDQMQVEDWMRVFGEARDLGIGFILLAGGEPMMRPDIIDKAGEITEILFPVFTNGTMFNTEYIETFKKKRNLIPIISMEGEESVTDKRRGKGIYKIVEKSMDILDKNKILFGVSITVTKENLLNVTDDCFITWLYNKGCKAVIFVEYVPATVDTLLLAPGDEERKYLSNALRYIRRKFEDMLFISFPGDEKSSGGCLAAGRGFFHINYNGNAEPCPFSPFSDINLKEVSLQEALNSKLFKKLQDNNILMDDHVGGCVLYEKRDLVEEMANVNLDYRHNS